MFLRNFRKMAISRDLGRVRGRAWAHFEAEIRGFRWTWPEKSQKIIKNRGSAAIFDFLCFLLISVQKKSLWRPRDRTLLYRVTEIFGAWSMVDIYLVGLLSSLVSLDALSTIRPGIGAIFFASVVVITMFAAHSFDPRLMWDQIKEESNKG